VLPVESKVSFRLTPGQVEAIRPGLQEIVEGYNDWRKTKQYPHARLLYVHPLSERQVAGRYDQELMEQILALSAGLNGDFPSGRRVKLNTIQIRAAIFAVRVGQDKVRLMARHMRKEALRTQQIFGADKQRRA
jgi:hypothetical protein